MANVYVKKSYRLLTDTIDTDLGTLLFKLNLWKLDDWRDGNYGPFVPYGNIVFQWQTYPIWKTKREDWQGFSIKSTLNKNDSWDWLWVNMYENQDWSRGVQLVWIEGSKRDKPVDNVDEDEAWKEPTPAAAVSPNDDLPF